MRVIISIVLWVMFGMGLAYADTPKRYASIVVDADSLEIIHARQIDEQRFPASLTKIMTLYLAFDAINHGELRLDETLTVSAKAARTPPAGLGLKRGQTITVDQAIQAIAVRSANDVAVVLAERLAGSEELFAARMTAKARELGMIKTTFKTANGLPNVEQNTTARDMAKLALAVLNNHRRYYHYFGQAEFNWKGRTKKNTNSLLHWLAGVDGFKTGFTNASGYNLVISAQRDGRRIIAVVLGGASGKSRDKHMQDLIEKGFKTLGVSPAPARPPVVVREETPAQEQPMQAVASAVRLRGSDGELVTVMTGMSGADDFKIPKTQLSWAIQVGAFNSPDQANAHLSALLQNGEPDIAGANKSISTVQRRGRTYHRARFEGLTAASAHTLCQKFAQVDRGCLVIAPGG